MHSIEIMLFMGECGARFRSRHLHVISDYIDKMLEDDRVIIISGNTGVTAVAFYSMCTLEECAHLHDEGTWFYKPQNIAGNTFYVDKIISKCWDRNLRMAIDTFAGTRFPKIEYGAWHRDRKGEDQLIISKRRTHVSN